VSVGPPGAIGTIMRIGRLGHVSACASVAHTHIVIARSASDEAIHRTPVPDTDRPWIASLRSQ
jgi:hypothetical protein